MSLTGCKTFIPWRGRSKGEGERKGGDTKKMCEYGHGYEHGYIGHEHAPYYPHHHMHEHHEHRQPLTKEKELETLEHWKKGMQDKLTEIEHRIEELKQEA